MATCPKCKQKLTFLNWKPQCPNCGVNLMLYGFEDKFYEDAKLTEMGNAKVRVWFAGVKTALIGGKLQIIRLVFCLLPVVALLLPYADFGFSVPMLSGDFSLGILGLVNSFSNGILNAVFSLRGAQLIGGGITLIGNALVAYFVVALFAVLGVVAEVLCFIKIKTMTKVMCGISVGGIVMSLICYAVTYNSVQALQNNIVFTSVGGYGAFACIAAFAAVLAVNLITLKKGIEVEYKEGDLYRIDVAKRLKKGKITLSEVPFPIYESKEEKEAREAAVKQTIEHTNAVAAASYSDSSKQGEEENN